MKQKLTWILDSFWMSRCKNSVTDRQFMQATIWAKTGVEVLERATRFLVLSRRNAWKETWCLVLLSAICHAMFYGWMFVVDSRPRFSKCILQKSTFMAIHTFGFYPLMLWWLTRKCQKISYLAKLFYISFSDSLGLINASRRLLE